MAIVLLLLAGLVVIVVAFIAVGHAVGSTEAMPRQIVIDSHEAIEFCAQALPGRVTASLSYDDLRRLLRLHLEWVQAYHWAPASQDATPIVFEQFDPMAYVLERCHTIGLEVRAEEAAAVIEAHTQYLLVVGALHIDDPVAVEDDLAQAHFLEPGRSRPTLQPGGAAPPGEDGADQANPEPAQIDHRWDPDDGTVDDRVEPQDGQTQSPGSSPMTDDK